MTTYNKTLLLLASKLGLEDEEKVLGKAAELERLLQTKTIAGNNMTDTSKIVICLDLATNICGVDLDLKTAIKYSGLKQPTYINSRKIVENLLEISSNKLTISALCLTLQCSKVQVLAEEILEEFKKKSKMEVDLSLPQYVCMAVYQACRINKVKISKSKMIEKSRLKPTQWAKLDTDWSKFVDDNFSSVKKKRGRRVKDNVENGNDDSEKMDTDACNNEVSTEPQIEPYEDWKRRMLEEAYKELKELQQSEKNQNMTPRRSPRKTPQKNSPCKTPNKVNGVRLLFPKDL
ncbi:unnamed protein product [Parnassius apollo]|uniref:(apollo) hypothetical protein n=1 Tax=Parnassius apollo TaxID=110799 RepID=A0A8S3YA29_PARAO|nr:unnamed protein product [Parnassius apollo]